METGIVRKRSLPDWMKTMVRRVILFIFVDARHNSFNGNESIALIRNVRFALKKWKWTQLVAQTIKRMIVKTRLKKAKIKCYAQQRLATEHGRASLEPNHSRAIHKHQNQNNPMYQGQSRHSSNTKAKLSITQSSMISHLHPTICCKFKKKYSNILTVLVITFFKCV